MAALVPPFYTSNILLLAGKICASEYDPTPLQHYSDRIRQIVVECLTVDPTRRPDICGIAQLCTEHLMLYTDRSCSTIQSLEKSLRKEDRQRDFYIMKQQSQLQQQTNYHQRCLSCSSTKESLISSSGGTVDVSFDGTDGQHDTIKAETSAMGMLKINLCYISHNFLFKHLIVKQMKLYQIILFHNHQVVQQNLPTCDVNRIDSLQNHCLVRLKVDLNKI